MPSSGTMRRPDPRAIDTTQMWGPPVDSRTPELVHHVKELKSELAGLAADVRRGPLEAYLTEASAYLGELRREFLRTHRRLLVQTRDEQRGHVPDLLRTELAELSDRLRSAVLARASRSSQEGWRPRRLDPLALLARGLQAPKLASSPVKASRLLGPNGLNPRFL